MATTVTVSSNYAGKVAGEIIGQMYKEADTIRLVLVTFAQNVNYKYNLRKIQYTDGTVDYSCGDFTPAGAIVLSEKVITPKKVMNNFQVCKEDFRQTWSEELEGASASNNTLASDIGEAILMEVLKSQSTKVDDDIWNGLNATGGEIGDGFIVQFAADAAVIKANNGIVPLAAAITEANVESELKKVLAAIPAKLRRQDLKVVVSANVFQAYWFYLVSKGIAWNGTADTKEAKFGKYTLTEVNGLPDNTIAVYDVKNLVMATGLLADFNDIRVVDEDEIGLLTGQVRGKMVYNGGVGYYNSDEIVWYLSTTAVV